MMDEIRKKIDDIDRTIVEAFSKRIELGREIGIVKREQDKPIFDAKREKEKIDALSQMASPEASGYVERLYSCIFELMREHEEKPAFGILGKSLPHTYSPFLHGVLSSNYSYSVIEREEDELDSLFGGKGFSGFNVTIPYKQEALRRCDFLSEEAKSIGAVNTVVFDENGRSTGYNTDAFGFMYTLTSEGILVKDRDVLVLGRGGASLAISFVLEKMGAKSITFVRRTGEINYSNVYEKCGDARIVINATPVGMFPDVEMDPIELSKFSKLEAVVDIIYNPARTKLMEDAKALGIRSVGGLKMLVAQAYMASLLFERKVASPYEVIDAPITRIDELTNAIGLLKKNITLVGMPGCGKTALGRKISALSGRSFLDLDECYEDEYGISPSIEIETSGEDSFRMKESMLIRKLLKDSEKVISTGGGVVEREENYFFLRCNSTVVYIRRPLEALCEDGRPLTLKHGKEELYRRRGSLYEKVSDIIIDVGAKESSVDFVEEAVNKLKEHGLL